MRFITFIYGIVSYAMFLATFSYAVFFVGDMLVPKTIDSGPTGAWPAAVLIDLALLGLFGLQHSVMARPAFKAVWTRVVPEPAERSTFVLAASLLLALLFWQWHPIAGVIWKVDSAVGGVLLQALFWTGWMLVLASTFMINHFDLFGLSQVFLHLRNQPYQPLPFVKVALYRFIRHPIMLGFLIAFWATPFMSLGHLVFTVATTGYIFVGIFLEERDMRRIHGEAYEQYRREAAMLLPLPNPDKPSKSRRPTIYM